MPLEDCVKSVAASMKGKLVRETVARAIARLESEAEIEVLPGAHDEIRARINRWLGVSSESQG
jgi:hypothetical protein